MSILLVYFITESGKKVHLDGCERAAKAWVDDVVSAASLCPFTGLKLHLIYIFYDFHSRSFLLLRSLSLGLYYITHIFFIAFLLLFRFYFLPCVLSLF